MAQTKIPAGLLDKSSHVDFADSEEIRLGTGNDLRIFHAGTENFIRGNATESPLYIDVCQNLHIRHLDTDGGNAETMIKGIGDGAVELYHNNGKKFETSATGASVTGNLAVSGNLTVSGTTTELDTTNLNVTDKNITLNYHASNDTSSNADGAGITIQDAVNASTNATLNWSAANDRFVMSHGLQVTSGSVGIGTTGPGRKLHLKDAGQIKLENTTTNGWAGLDIHTSVGTNNYDMYMGMLDSNGRFFIDVDSNGEDLTILQNGNVGIGQSNPSNKLHLKAGASGASSFDSRYNLTIEDNGENYIGMYVPNNSFAGIRFLNAASSIRGYIDYYHGSQGDKMQIYAQNHIEFGYPTVGVKQIFKADGSVGIGTASPGDTLEVFTSAANKGITIKSGTGSSFENPTLTFIDVGNSTSTLAVKSDAFCFSTYGVTNALTITGSNGALTNNPAAGGHVLFNNAGNNVDFRIKTNNNNDTFFVDGGADVVKIGHPAGIQSIAGLGVRRNGAAIEFGHTNNGAGYFGTVGAFGSSGHPYIGFSTACESGSNNFSTYGHLGNIIYGDLSGHLRFARVTSASATGQTPVETMMIKSNGNVGIGTTDPSNKLEISGTGGTRIKVINTDTNWAALDLQAGGNQANYIFFRDGSAERARIMASDGNEISFSTGASPVQRLKISNGNDIVLGTGAVNEAAKVISSGGTTIIRAADTNHSIILRGTQDASGNVTGNSNTMGFYEYGGYEFYTKQGNSRVKSLDMPANGKVNIATSAPRSKYFDVNGVAEINESFNLNNSIQYDFEYTVTSEAGTGNSYFIIAGYNHFFNTSYGAHRVAFMSARGTSIASMINLGEQNSAGGGQWQFTKPTATTLRIRKTGGNYSGNGHGFIKVIFRNY